MWFYFFDDQLYLNTVIKLQMLVKIVLVIILTNSMVQMGEKDGQLMTWKML